MSRWNLAGIFLFSHDGRCRDLDLTPGAVNVICGGSNTGKSALIEIIDYTLGSSRCRIADFIRTSTAWVATCWRRDAAEFLTARRIPPTTQRSTDECLFLLGGREVLPTDAAALRGNANREGLLAQLARQFGMGSMVVGDSLGEEARRIGVRAVTPYLFLSGGVISNPDVLLRGLEGERRRSIIDSFPYLIGAVDEHTVELIARLRARRRQERALVREIAETEAIVTNQATRSQTLLTEAIELGLVLRSEAPTEVGPVLDTLASLQDWTPGPETPGEDPQLDELHMREEGHVEELHLLRAQERSARELREASTLFGASADSQHKRLEPIGLLADLDVLEQCPLCSNSLADDDHPSVESLRVALRQLDSELTTVSQDRPRLDEYIRQTEERVQQTSTVLREVRRRIQALVRERENIVRRIELDGRRHRVIGRISLFLEAVARTQQSVDRSSELDSLRAEIAELEAVVGAEARQEATREARDRLNFIASQFVQRLPFDEHYRDSVVALNAANLEVSVITHDRAIPMPDVGSDENWLTLHIAFAFAFHRLFEARERPVPGLLVLDQLSRPYYPDDVARRTDELAPRDEQKLLQYIRLVFEETAARTGLQVLLVEHARLRQDAQYRGAVVEEWETGGPCLVPSDWPTGPTV